ncbi:MAG: ATP-binding cassette domain-containing protein [Sphaerochaeta sp.]|nr:ATP-binding cassette domain-containing protein [Sphaerochaeta sp.]
MSSLIELNDVSATYGNLTAIKHVNFSMDEGESRVLTGESGSGKSTLAKILSGLINVQEGQVFIHGKKVFANPKMFVKEHVEYVPRKGILVRHFTIAKNFYLFSPTIRNGFFYDKNKERKKIQEFFNRWDIDLNSSERIANLYLSDQVLVSILLRIYRNPELLILDESLDSLSQSSFEKVLQIINAKHASGMACLIISHDIENTRNIAETISIMRKGEILFTESVKDIDTFNIIKLTYANFRLNEDTSNARDFYQLLRYNEAILESLPVNVLVLDKDQKIKLINNSAVDFFHVDKKSLIGSDFSALLLSRNDGVISNICAALMKEEKLNILNQMLHIEDSIKNVNVTLYPIKESGTVIGEMVIFFDTTETAQLREKISYIDKMSSISILSAGIAHEINNPLGIINNCLDYLSSELTNNDQKEIIQEVENQILSISRIISSLISYSSPNVNVSIRFDVKRVIEEVYIFFKYYGKEKGVKINLEKISKKVFAFAKVSEIKQILLNILKNAVEAMKNGGNIWIALDASEDGNDIIIRIRDDGPGLILEHINDVFLPFYSTKAGENIGLGLYLCHNLAKNNHGDIQVENMFPHGCLFSLQIPRDIS